VSYRIYAKDQANIETVKNEILEVLVERFGARAKIGFLHRMSKETGLYNLRSYLRVAGTCRDLDHFWSDRPSYLAGFSCLSVSVRCRKTPSVRFRRRERAARNPGNAVVFRSMVK
jgi:hypothetical protein